MTCIHHYSVIQSIFTTLKILCALQIQPFRLPPPPHPQSLILSLSPRFFLFQNIRQLELHNRQLFQIGFFHLAKSVQVSFIFSVMHLSFSSSLYLKIHVFSSLCGCLSWLVYPFMYWRACSCFQVWVVLKKATVNMHISVFNSFGEIPFSFSF